MNVSEVMHNYYDFPLIDDYRKYVFSPNFVIESTPSIDACFEAIAKNHRFIVHCFGDDMQEVYDNRFNYGLKSKDADVLVKKFNECLSESKGVFDKLRDYRVSPPSCIKGKRLEMWRDLLACYLKLEIEEASEILGLNSTTCFFEEEDFLLNRLESFFNPVRYKVDSSRDSVVSFWVDLLNKGVKGREGYQHADLTLVTKPDSIDLVYYVRNYHDKVHSVVEVVPGSGITEVKHYETVTKSPRDSKYAMDLEFDLKKAESGNFVLEPHQVDGMRLFIDEEDEGFQKMRGFLLRNPIFLGGNGFLSLCDFVLENYGFLQEVAEDAKRMLN